MSRESISNQLSTKTKRVFIGGVATQTTNEELSEYFSQFGKVEAKKAVPKEVMSTNNTLIKQRHQFIRAPLPHFLPGQLNGAAAAAAAAAATYTLTATSPITARQPSAYAYLPGYYLSPGECPLSQPLSVFLPPTAILPPYANVISMT
ncbi:unnamed protein product [Trichobilharzia regenti]|nr:unnamed protein product [Trichobilharzia regenti]